MSVSHKMFALQLMTNKCLLTIKVSPSQRCDESPIVSLPPDKIDEAVLRYVFWIGLHCMGKNAMMQATAIMNPETGRLAVTKDKIQNATLK